jgi:putative transposase
MQLRKIAKTRGHLATDDAATKLLSLALRNIVTKWRRARLHWTAAPTDFAQLFGDRFTPEV